MKMTQITLYNLFELKSDTKIYIRIWNLTSAITENDQLIHM